MIDLKEIKKVYFIGIGGIGMSALARYFRGQGREVSGYDKTATPLTWQLQQEGIAVHYEEDLSLAPKDADLIIYTPAVPKDHKELLYYQQHQYNILKRSDVLGVITNSSFNICVAGTHGKTTITTMIAHILRHSGYGCNAFLGGIAVNYNSNFWSDSRNVCVVEADEYDRSFLKLFPDIAVITAMDADHLDIYGTAVEMERAFVEFSGKIKQGGTLLSKFGLQRSGDLKGDRHLTYGLMANADGAGHHGGAARGYHGGDETGHHNNGSAQEGPDVFASDILIKEGSYHYQVRMKDWRLENIVLNMGGMHNVENSIAAIAVAHLLRIDDDRIRNAVAAFRGVKRRFEYMIRRPGLVFIDDYAHHPEELRALISGAKGLFPAAKCTVIFQPHLFSRTRDFADGFAESLDLADQVYLLPIYPAREQPIAGVTSELIAAKMPARKVRVCEQDEVLKTITATIGAGHAGDGPQLVITAGAGDIDAMVAPIRDILEKKYE